MLADTTEPERGEGRLGDNLAGVAPGDPQPVCSSAALYWVAAGGGLRDNSAGSLPSGTLWPKSSQGKRQAPPFSLGLRRFHGSLLTLPRRVLTEGSGRQ